MKRMVRLASLRAPSIAVLAVLAGVGMAHAQSLKGSPASLTRQNAQAHEHDFSYLRTSSQVRSFIDQGLLVRVRGSADVALDDDVMFPYARTEVRLFVERLGEQYRDACGEKLVVTSLTRPLSRQPANASDRSVHPTGMALDLRKSKRRACRRWMEETLLALEDRGVIEATLERRPPHYHIAVYPGPYRRYVSSQVGAVRLASASESGARESKGSDAGGKAAASSTETRSAAEKAAEARYKVNRGDTLWGIARKHGTTVAALKEANRLRTGRIVSGQVLTIPAR